MKDFVILSIFVLLFTLTGCSTDTSTDPAIAPFTSSANDMFNSEVSQLNDYAYDKGQHL